jgi:hypothetical protein
MSDASGGLYHVWQVSAWIAGRYTRDMHRMVFAKLLFQHMQLVTNDLAVDLMRLVFPEAHSRAWLLVMHGADLEVSSRGDRPRRCVRTPNDLVLHTRPVHRWRSTREMVVTSDEPYLSYLSLGYLGTFPLDWTTRSSLGTFASAYILQGVTLSGLQDPAIGTHKQAHCPPPSPRRQGTLQKAVKKESAKDAISPLANVRYRIFTKAGTRTSALSSKDDFLLLLNVLARSEAVLRKLDGQQNLQTSLVRMLMRLMRGRRGRRG